MDLYKQTVCELLLNYTNTGTFTNQVIVIKYFTVVPMCYTRNMTRALSSNFEDIGA